MANTGISTQACPGRLGIHPSLITFPLKTKGFWSPKTALKICAVYAIALVAVFWGFGNLIMGIFVSDDLIIKNAVTGIHITSVFMIFLGSTQITRYFLNGAGDTVYSMANGMIEIGCKLIFVFLMTNIPFIGQWGIWWTIGFTWLCTAVFALCRYKSGKWQKICTK